MTARQLQGRRAVTSVEQHGLLGTTPVELGPDEFRATQLHRSATGALLTGLLARAVDNKGVGGGLELLGKQGIAPRRTPPITTALPCVACRHVWVGSSAYRGVDIVPTATQRQPANARAMTSDGRHSSGSCGHHGAMHVGSVDFAKPSDTREASSSAGDIAAGAIGLQRPPALRSEAREQARVSCVAELRETGDPS